MFLFDNEISDVYMLCILEGFGEFWRVRCSFGPAEHDEGHAGCRQSATSDSVFKKIKIIGDILVQIFSKYENQ